MQDRLSRRQFLRLSGVAAASPVLAACAGERHTNPPKTPPAKEDPVLKKEKEGKTQKPSTPEEGVISANHIYLSVSTMKVSRDMAREFSEEAKAQIPERISFMAEEVRVLGANMITWDTPYEAEFVPLLEREIEAAEQNGLEVFLRGNITGFQEERDASGPTGHGWFGYPLLESPEEHHAKIREYILANKHLFVTEDGRTRVHVFSPAPEPENGMIGDPRVSPEVKAQFDAWLFASYKNARTVLDEIGATETKVSFSFNGDVAKILPEGFINENNPVLVDHYVRDVSRYITDTQEYGTIYEAPVGYGEIGAPIPDIHGPMIEDEQAAYIEKMFEALLTTRTLIPAVKLQMVNYWHLWNPYDGDQSLSTALLNADRTRRKAFDIVQEGFRKLTLHSL